MPVYFNLVQLSDGVKFSMSEIMIFLLIDPKFGVCWDILLMGRDNK